MCLDSFLELMPDRADRKLGLPGLEHFLDIGKLDVDTPEFFG
jgi:hypothetical protein